VAIPAALMTALTLRDLTAALIAVGLVLAPGTPLAAAHVQVRPTTAAPDDAVLFEVLVPNERDNRTVAVELAVPAGVLPYSYEDPPGWRRTLTLNPNQSIRSILWRGRLREDGFVRFGFLAATPPREGEIPWRAVQTYEDGRKVRWIGPPDSEEPAAVTTVSERFPRQDAGGEAAGEASPAQPQRPAAPRSETAADGAAGSGDSDGSDTTARWLAAGALAAALASLALVLLRRPTGRPTVREQA
jgi:uncharacterized protein YcnI